MAAGIPFNKKHELLINVVLIKVKLKKLFNNPVPKLFSVRSEVPFVNEKKLGLFLFLKLLLKHSFHQNSTIISLEITW
jgi:hypothetical protein